MFDPHITQGVGVHATPVPVCGFQEQNVVAQIIQRIRGIKTRGTRAYDHDIVIGRGLNGDHWRRKAHDPENKKRGSKRLPPVRKKGHARTSSTGTRTDNTLIKHCGSSTRYQTLRIGSGKCDFLEFPTLEGNTI